MTIASEIQRIQTNIANAYDALEAKGATMPATENTDNLVTTIDTISSGGGDVITATNKTGSAVSTGDKVWINESVTSLAATTAKTLGYPFDCAISPDGSKLFTGNSNTANASAAFNIYDIMDLSNISLLYTKASGSSIPTIQYLDSGNLAITFDIASSEDIIFRRNGTYGIYNIGDLSYTSYLHGTYWGISSSSVQKLITLDENDGTQTLVASGSNSSGSKMFTGCYNTTTGKILRSNSGYCYIVSGSSITSQSGGGVNIGSSATYSTSSKLQGSLIIRCQSYSVGQGSNTPANGTFQVGSWDGSNGYTQYNLDNVGLGYWDGKSVWAIYNQVTKILTIASYFGTDYKVYRYDAENNHFDEVTIELNTAGNKFVSPITFTDDMTRCAYACVPAADTSLVNYSNVSYVVEGLSNSTSVILSPYSFSIIYRNTLTGVAKENIASGSTGEVLTLLPSEPASKKKRLVSVADNLDTNKLVLYTDDGINWNTSTMPNSRNWGHPFYGDGKFIVADYQSGIFAYSSDGINWTEGTAFSTQYNTYTVLRGTYGNGVYLLACNTGNTGTGYLFKSTDGINWTNGYNFYDVSDSPGKMIDFIFDGNRFVAFFEDHACQYSTDGVSWTKAGIPFNSAYKIPNNRATTIYDSVNSRYIHGVGFYEAGSTSTKPLYIYTSTDLTNWTEIYTHSYNNVTPVTSCILDGETKIFSGWSSLSQQAAGYVNIDSTGTATFVGSSVPRLNYQGGANVINDRAVVIGYGSDQYIYSTDGTTWNTGTLPASSGWWGSCVGEVD